MRLIEFRGVRKDTGRFVRGYLNIRDKQAFVRRGDSICEVFPGLISQFTGEYDSRNRKIFENDLCEYKTGVFLIIFKHGCFGFESRGKFTPLSSLDLSKVVVTGTCTFDLTLEDSE